MEISQEQKMYAEVVQKAWEDADFKKALIANPIETIEGLIGHKLVIPKGQKFVVKDQTDESTVYWNIPRNIDIDNLQLTDEQLEMVAGGVTPLIVCTVTLVAGGVCIGEGIGKLFN